MMQPGSTTMIRPVEQAGRLLGSLVAAGQPHARPSERVTVAGDRATALQVWVKAGRNLAAADDDVEAFVRAYQDAFQSYFRS
jgi:hypothetical protein